MALRFDHTSLLSLLLAAGLLSLAVSAVQVLAGGNVPDGEPRRTNSAGKRNTNNAGIMSVSIINGHTLWNSHYNNASTIGSSSLRYLGGAPVASGWYLSLSSSYFARMLIGGREFYLLIDTGSDLTWIQCQPCVSCFDQIDQPLFDPDSSSTLHRVSGSSPLCSRQNGAFTIRPSRDKKSCRYKVSYADGFTTSGTFVQDTFILPSLGHAVPEMTFGCSTKSSLSGAPTPSGAAGILGLGMGSYSFPSELRLRSLSGNFSYCFPPMYSDRTSDLTFGGPVATNTIFIPLLENPAHAETSHYYVPLIGISVGGSRLSIPSSVFDMDSYYGDGGTIIDCGTAFSLFPTSVYLQIRDVFREAISANAKQLRVADPFPGSIKWDTCYELKPGYQEDQLYDGVPSITLHFAGNADLELPPANLLASFQRPPRTDKRVCLALAEADDSLHAMSLIGNIQQQHIRFTFDVENKRLGFQPNAC